MTDRDKVIEAIENCIALPEKCKNCPWEECEEFDTPMVELPRKLIENAFELLKEQEPAKPIDQGDDSYVCDKCGETVGWEELDVFGIDPVKYKFCPGCGRKVNWDADK